MKKNRRKKECSDSNAHWHDDVAVARGFVGKRPKLAGGLFVFQFEADGAIGSGGKKIENVLRVETDGDRVSLEFFFDHLFCFAVFGAGGGNFHAFFREHEFHGAGALVGELRDAAERVLKLAALDYDGLARVARQDSFVIRKLPGEFARSEQASAELKEEMAFILGEFEHRAILGVS